ncbi:recombination-associated protein RdgC [Oryzomicrobium sp.]|uniref:recombination-associated protein RdgC n=1 Tax=Oryzomicrobium sp. TaxID=1911578 RepID=UPI0025EFCCC5|nr:recombination-associated protein RdgC [Oryzomicrobium sp.]MCE1244911.1 recombination-associated protein RdgC [Oryzomicrobium sp.]
MNIIIKSARVYRAKLPATAELMANHLTELAFTELGEHDYCRSGFVPAGDGTQELVRTLPGSHIRVFATRYDEKIIPAAAVKAALAKRCDEIAELEGYRPGRKWVRELRDEVFAELKTRALHRSTVVLGFYNPGTHALVLATSSNKLAARVISDLVKVVGSVETTTIHVDELKQGLTTRLTDHLAGKDSFGDFEPAGAYWLRLDNEKVTIQASSDEGPLREAMSNGLQVDAIRLNHHAVTFKLGADFVFRGISFTDLEEEQPADDAFEAWGLEALFQFMNLEAAIDALCELVGYVPPGSATTD